MKIQISHGADPDNWFVVEPMPHQNAQRNAEQVASLLRVGRTVYELNAGPFLGDQRQARNADARILAQAMITDGHRHLQIADILAAAVTTDGAHHKQHDLEQIAAILGIELPDHEPGIPA